MAYLDINSAMDINLKCCFFKEKAKLISDEADKQLFYCASVSLYFLYLYMIYNAKINKNMKPKFC